VLGARKSVSSNWKPQAILAPSASSASFRLSVVGKTISWKVAAAAYATVAALGTLARPSYPNLS